MFELEDLTEEQNKAVNSEIDRRVTEAVKTNTTKVTEQVTETIKAQLQSEFDKKLETEKKQLSMTEEEKTQALLDELENQKRDFNKSKIEFAAERKLREGGLNTEAITALMPMFVPNGDVEESTVTSTIDSYLQTQKKAIDDALEKQRKDFAGNGNLPSSMDGKTPPTDINTQVANILNDENIDPLMAGAYAVQALLNNQDK